jgi:hypothetical protein
MKFQADIKRRKARIDELSKVLEWDKSALETIKQSTNDRENDIEFMSKYLVLDKKMASVCMNTHRLGVLRWGNVKC